MQPSTTFASQSTSPVAYLRRVYTWLLAGIGIAGVGGYAALNMGTPVRSVVDKHDVVIAPIAAAMVAHPFASSMLFLAITFVTAIVRRVPGLNAVAFFSLTAFSGAFVAPLIVIAQAKAAAGTALVGHPVLDAFVLTAAAFLGLTAYTLTTKRDFEFLGASLMMGLWVLIAALFVGIFLGSNAFSLATSSVAVLLFAGFILYDTSKVLRSSDRDDPIGDALNLYLDVLNIFVHLVSIFSGGSKRD